MHASRYGKYVVGQGGGGGGLTRSSALGLVGKEWSGTWSSLTGKATLSGMVAIPFSRCALAACADAHIGVGVAGWGRCPGVDIRRANKAAEGEGKDSHTRERNRGKRERERINGEWEGDTHTHVERHRWTDK